MRAIRRLSGGMLAAILAVLLGAPVIARGQDTPALAIISSPAHDAPLFGPVNITGTALHPTAFAGYTLEYDLASEVGEQWYPVQERVTQQVQDGVLGTWDTTTVPDGIYQLRLRVYLHDGSFSEAVVSGLRIQNSQPTPMPTLGPALAAPGAQPPTPGPSPTSPIVQPPSSNPQPAPGAEQARSADTGEPRLLQSGSGGSRINFSRVRQAFCTGGYLALGVFAVLGLYSAVRHLSRRRPARDYPDGDY